MRSGERMKVRRSHVHMKRTHLSRQQGVKQDTTLNSFSPYSFSSTSGVCFWLFREPLTRKLPGHCLCSFSSWTTPIHLNLHPAPAPQPVSRGCCSSRPFKTPQCTYCFKGSCFFVYLILKEEASGFIYT